MLVVLRGNDESLEELKLQGSFSRDGLESEILRYARKISKTVGIVMAERLRECYRSREGTEGRYYEG